jgi:formate dehydrogenase
MTPGDSYVEAPGADGLHRTFCRLCEAQCGMVVRVEGGEIAKVSPDRAHPVSEGHICVKGPGMASITYDPDRVLTPLKRVGGPGEFEPVSWDEALDDIAARLKAITAQDPTGVGIFTGNPASFATLHSGYAALFIKALGGDKRFNSVHIDTGAKNLAQELVFGGATDWTFPDLEDCDFLIMIGANPMVSHMSLIAEPRVLHKLQTIDARGGVVVIDPRRTETAQRFEHLSVRPDSDVWLLGAMLNHLFEAGLERRDVLEARTTGWEALREAVSPITPEIAAARCGASPEAIRNLAERFAGARTAACYGRVGTNRGRYSTLTNILIESLNVVAGRFAEPGGWITGVSPMGDPTAPPTFAPYGSARSRIGDLPLILGSTPGGALAAEITTPGAGQLKALFVDSGNPVMSYPRGDELAEAIEGLDLCVALDFYITETTRLAHYILPAATFYEREDLTDYWVRNAPRPWLQFTPAVIPPRGEARVEFDIYNAILARLGLPKLFEGASLMAAADGLLRQGAWGDRFGDNPEGFSIERLRREFPSGVQVAERAAAEESWSRVRTEDGRLRLWHEVTQAEIGRLLAEAQAETPDGSVLYLFGRRKLSSLNSWMHNVERLVRSERPTLLMHPDDARDRQIADGQQVRLASKIGAVEVEAELTLDVAQGSVNYPHGWGHVGGWRRANALPGANINLIASSDPEDWEQVSGMVHVDGIPVTVSPA